MAACHGADVALGFTFFFYGHGDEVRHPISQCGNTDEEKRHLSMELL